MSNALEVLLAFLHGGTKTIAEAHRHLMGRRVLVYGVEVENIIQEAGSLVVVRDEELSLVAAGYSEEGIDAKGPASTTREGK